MNGSKQYLEALSQLSLEDVYIQQAFKYYRDCYLASEWAQRFVPHSQRVPEDMRDHPWAGLCDRTLGVHIPKRKTLEGGAIRGSLQRVRLLLPTGGELFRGCVVFPSFDEHDRVIAAVGYRYASRVRRWQQAVIRWKKPSIAQYIEQGLAQVDGLIYGKAQQ